MGKVPGGEGAGGGLMSNWYGDPGGGQTFGRGRSDGQLNRAHSAGRGAWVMSRFDRRGAADGPMI